MASKETVKKIEEIIKSIEELKSGFENSFDEHSDSWKESERGEKCLENIDYLDSAIDALENIE